jgi:hypothetical protein
MLFFDYGTKIMDFDAGGQDNVAELQIMAPFPAIRFNLPSGGFPLLSGALGFSHQRKSLPIPTITHSLSHCIIGTHFHSKTSSNYCQMNNQACTLPERPLFPRHFLIKRIKCERDTQIHGRITPLVFE